MSVTLRLADNDAAIVRDALDTLAKIEQGREVTPLTERRGEDVVAALFRLSAAFGTAVLANVRQTRRG